MASKPVQNITRESGFFYALHPLAGISLFLPLKRIALRAVSGALARSAFSHTQNTLKTDRVHSGVLARHSTAKKIFRRPKSHYTAPACGFWIIKIFQFYFSTNQTATPRHCWPLCEKHKLKRLKKFSLFFTFMDLHSIKHKA
ncbi:hypothetical protein QCN13_14870 [Enterobacter hormaechei]|uniref:hypothetical protein n=1 Tax=Enterobacter hormaechei TaxID=158836 RepID=UPI002FD84F05